MLSNQNAQTGRLRAGILQRFDFAHPHDDAELFAFSQCAFGVGCTAIERLPDDVACDFRIEHSLYLRTARSKKSGELCLSASTTRFPGEFSAFSCG